MEVQYTPKNQKTPVSIHVGSPENALEVATTLWRGSDLEASDIVITEYPFTDELRDNVRLNVLNWLNNKRWNPNGMKNHVLMLKEGKISDEKFWETIDKMGWTKDFDYKRIREDFEKGVYGGKGSALAVLYKFMELQSKLKKSIYEELKKNNLKYNDVIDLGDDGFGDLTSHIIGMGRKTYERALKDPVFAGSQDYPESFSYVFQFSFL